MALRIRISPVELIEIELVHLACFDDVKAFRAPTLSDRARLRPGHETLAVAVRPGLSEIRYLVDRFQLEADGGAEEIAEAWGKIAQAVP